MIALAWLLALSCPQPVALPTTAPGALLAQTESVPRRASAEAQLEYARKKKGELRGRSGEARMEARRAAIAAYRVVRRYFPRERALGAEAAFRAGELLRSAHLDDEAREEFSVARDLGKGTVYGPRGGLELAHMYRRRGRSLDALASYEAVTAMEEVDREFSDRARYWAGRIKAKLGRHVEARRSWERVAREGASPLIRIDAFEAWADSLISAEDLEGAAGVLELCRRELQAMGDERTRLGLRVRHALERMPSVKRLARAIAERAKARREARRGGAGRPLSSRCRST